MAAPPAFLVPVHLEDLELPKGDRAFVRTVHALEGRPAEELARRLRELEGRVLGGASNDDDDGADDVGTAGRGVLGSDATFDLCYSFVRKLPGLPEAIQARVLETFATIVSSATKDIRASVARVDDDKVDTHRNNFKAAVYFLATATMTLSRQRAKVDKAALRTPNQSTASPAKVAWAKLFENALSALGKSICDETFGMWRMNLPEEAFASLYCRAGLSVMETPSLCRSKTLKQEIIGVIGHAMRRVQSVRLSMLSTIVDLIFNNDHATMIVVQLTEQLAGSFDYAAFPGDLIREIAAISCGDPSKDVSGTRNISSFLAALSNRSPALVISNLSFVLGLLESESYQLRNAGTACIAYILLWSFQQRSVNETGNHQPEVQAIIEMDDQAHEHEVARSSDRHSVQVSPTTRDRLLAVLEDRVHDINSFGRSHTLKMWYMLCEHGAVPHDRLKSVITIVIGRLQDKAAVVRRQSLALLALQLESNPFMGNLDLKFHGAKATSLKGLIDEKRKNMIAKAQQAMDTDILTSDTDDQISSDGQSATNGVNEERELAVLRQLFGFHMDAVEFLTALADAAMPLVNQLLNSKSTTDVVESISFVQRAYQAGIPGAECGLKKVLALTWKSDPAIRDEVSSMFNAIFLQCSSDKERSASEVAAANLIQLLDHCTLADAACVEKIIGELYREGQIPVGVVSVLWRFVDCVQFPPPVVINSLVLLSMVATVDDAIVLSSDRLRLLVASAFRQDAHHRDRSFRMFGAGCRLLQQLRMSGIRKGGELTKTQSEIVEKIVGQIQRILALKFDNSDWKSSDHASWLDAVQRAIDVIFIICEQPEAVCADITKSLYVSLFMDETSNVVDTVELAHFFFVVGHIAVRTAIHIEALGATIKQLRSKQQAIRQEQPADSTVNGNHEVTTMEDELGVAAEVEAEEDSFVSKLVRQDVVCRDLVGSFGPVIARFVRTAYKDTSIDALVIESAVVALSKCMAVSEDYCDKHLQLLFTVLQESTVPTVRANIVVAVGDLAFRFPNLIEPWTSHLYNRLHDVDNAVRKNVVVVLSHLILNDMVKVKGQICEIAMALVDPISDIRSLVRMFFDELSQKGSNPIYNVLPDTVNILSLSEIIGNEEYKTIVKFLLGYLTKDKQIESIVEKLVHRFASAQLKQQRDFAFCLASIHHTEKSLRFLFHVRRQFKGPLLDPSILEQFKLLISRSRRHLGTSTTPELREAIEQLEQYVTIESQQVDDEVSPPSGLPTSKLPTPKTAPKPVESHAEVQKHSRRKKKFI